MGLGGQYPSSISMHRGWHTRPCLGSVMLLEQLLGLFAVLTAGDDESEQEDEREPEMSDRSSEEWRLLCLDRAIAFVNDNGGDEKDIVRVATMFNDFLDGQDWEEAE